MAEASQLELNPAQQRTREVLGSGGSLPEFPADIGPCLREQLERELAPLVDGLPDHTDLAINKHLLSLVHGCEARMVAEEAAGFVVTVPVARGCVAHKAIELGIHWRGEGRPLELVDEALARLTERDHWLTDWLRTCSEADRAELRSEAGDRVTKFFECFPPLLAAWRPVTESSLVVELLDGRTWLRGKVDLTIGRAQGTGAGKVIIDLKTGGAAPGHRDDLRFYALLETIRIGVPPRLLASYYLDQGVAQPEVVTVGLLEATLARTVDGVRRIVALRSGQAPVKRPSRSCRWCVIRSECVEGRAFLRSIDDREDAEDPV